MKKAHVAAAVLGLVCAASSAMVSAQVNRVYWTTSGFGGPFPISGLIPSIPKEKERQITVPISM